MKVQKIKTNEERRLLAAMVTDRVVLARIVTLWDGELFRNSWANLVAGWCVDFYQRYEKAPNKAIRGLFERWASKNKDETTVGLIERFLSSVSNEASDQVNSNFMLDVAANVFNQNKIRRLAAQLEGDIDSADITGALERVSSFNRVELGQGSAINVLQDMTALQLAFDKPVDPVIEYPGALGQFFRGQLERDALIAFMAPEKRGKTFWLMDLAWLALKQKRRVAIFQAGDLSQNQMLRRLGQRMARWPKKPGTVRIPKEMRWIDGEDDTKELEIDYTEREYEVGLDFGRVQKAIADLQRVMPHTKKPLLKLDCHPTDSLSVPMIDSILKQWERSEDWTPDVVVIDYADILAPINSRSEGRDQINDTWKRLRRLSQERRCLVITATQSDATSYYAKTLSREHFANDKRKFAHVNGMVGINQTNEEKERGIFRLNWIVLREDEFIESQCCHTASCLALSCPAVLSL